MRNKKGFTLVELLAIIVILAVIMVIAVPKILDVVNGSKTSAWKNSVGMIKKAISNNSQLLDPETGVQKYSISNLCSNPSKFSEIVKMEDTTVSCEKVCNASSEIEDINSLLGYNKKTGINRIALDVNGEMECPSYTYIFKLIGNGQFAGKSASILCNGNSCTATINKEKDPNALAAGLYDDSNSLIASWDSLINDYHMHINSSTLSLLGYNDNRNKDDGKIKRMLVVSHEDRTMQYYIYATAADLDAEKGITEVGWYRNEYGYLNNNFFSNYTKIDDITSESSYQPAVVLEKGNLKNGTKLVLPDDMVNVSGFDYCINLKEIVLPYETVNISHNAFNNCISLKKVTIPDTVAQIEMNAFRGTALNEVTFEDPNNWKATTMELLAQGVEPTPDVVLNANDLKNKQTAALYLRSTYVDKTWKKNQTKED